MLQLSVAQSHHEVFLLKKLIITSYYLEEYTKYNISVRVYTIMGVGPYSDVIIQSFHDSTYCIHTVG